MVVARDTTVSLRGARVGDDATSARAEARRAVAQELHDGLAQDLTALVLALDACQRDVEGAPGTLARQLAIVSREARASLADLRRYMTALRQQDEDLTLPVTLSRLVEDVRRASGLALDLVESGRDRALRPQVERAIARIAQESLHNAAQHAAASHVRVALAYEPSAVVLTVVDDGCGFDLERTLAISERQARFGLLGMRERAAAVDGELVVRTKPGRGTAISARIPYDRGTERSEVAASRGGAEWRRSHEPTRERPASRGLGIAPAIARLLGGS